MTAQPQTPGSLVGSQAAFEELVGLLERAERIALDTEFHRERTYYPRLALVQVAWGGEIALIDPLAVDVSGLARAFDGPLFVLHAADQDLEVLMRACGRLPARLFDTQLSAGFLGHSTPSLGNLVESVLGVTLQKGDQLTDWMQRPLSQSQMTYAASDVAYLLELAEVISKRLAERGREEWAAEECSLLLARNYTDGPLEEAWWRLPRSGQIRGKARGVAQEVSSWRELRARRLDIPARFVLSDLAVISLAQRPPTAREELMRTRGVDGRHIAGPAGTELLEAIKKGQHLSSSALRLPPAARLERPNRPVVALSSAYVSQRAFDLAIDPAILATRADLLSFFQDPPRGRLTKGWRHELLGAGLGQLAGGSAALAFDGSGELVLEERSGRRL